MIIWDHKHTPTSRDVQLHTLSENLDREKADWAASFGAASRRRKTRKRLSYEWWAISLLAALVLGIYIGATVVGNR